MGSNKRDLKAYVRIDGSGRVVAGSLVLRRKMPKVGKWMEIQAYECCNPTTTTTTTAPATTTTTTSFIPVSDFRLKDNITATGNFVAGLPEYTWTWNSTAVALGVDNHPTTGVLAQEALLLYPEFVVFDTTIGYYRVNYEELAKA
jgi:hypothetical protein